VKTSGDANNAAKSIALDHLGLIAARVRGAALKYKGDSDANEELLALGEIISKGDHASFKRLCTTQRDILAFLCKRSGEDQAFDVSFFTFFVRANSS
jgi:cohesin loading factor subunit SCC2